MCTIGEQDLIVMEIAPFEGVYKDVITSIKENPLICMVFVNYP
jgi:hypothetical protein